MPPAHRPLHLLTMASKALRREKIIWSGEVRESGERKGKMVMHCLNSTEIEWWWRMDGWWKRRKMDRWMVEEEEDG